MKKAIEQLKVVVIDYDVGNLGSLVRALQAVGVSPVVSSNPEEVMTADAVVLPGVGAFASGMDGLKNHNLISSLQAVSEKGISMLGICLGAQILLSRGFEFGEHAGLGFIDGDVVPFHDLILQEKVPHVGWNEIMVGERSWEGTVLSDIPPGTDFYFVHSYIMEPSDKDSVLAKTSYGGKEFCSVVQRGNIYGCQFHPEKSGQAGLQIFSNFIQIANK